MTTTKMKKAFGSVLLGLMTMALAGSADAAAAQAGKPKSTWRVPSRHARKKNPQIATRQSIASGKALFARECLSCHGESGLGNGPASKDLEVKPADLGSLKVQSQTDGGLYWMIGTGRSPMPSFKDSLSAEERWNLVNFIRTFASPADPLGRLLGSYGGLQLALSAATEEPALKEAAKLVKATEALATFDPAELSKRERGAWVAQVGKLREASAAVAAAKDLESLRSAFASLSLPLAASLKMLPAPGRVTLRLFRCPTALGGRAASWLQEGEKPLNPYRPDHPGCGKLLEEIPKRSAPKKAAP